jgi:hypothetical protein
LRGEPRLKVFENKVLRRIFGPRRDEVTGEWRILHNKELYAVCSFTRVIKSRRLRRAGHVVPMGREEVHRGFWWGNLREGGHVEDMCRWENNIKIDLREVGKTDMD